MIKRLLVGTSVRRTIIRSAITVVFLIFFFLFLFRPIHVSGRSMEPAIQDGSYHFVLLTAYVNNNPQRGDIVGVRDHSGQLLYLKRILGRPGEELQLVEGRLLINGSVVEEPYVNGGATWDTAPIQLDSGQYFIAGDNRTMPMYRHVHGIVESRSIGGRLCF